MLIHPSLRQTKPILTKQLPTNLNKPTVDHHSQLHFRSVFLSFRPAAKRGAVLVCLDTPFLLGGPHGRPVANIARTMEARGWDEDEIVWCLYMTYGAAMKRFIAWTRDLWEDYEDAPPNEEGPPSMFCLRKAGLEGETELDHEEEGTESTRITEFLFVCF